MYKYIIMCKPGGWKCWNHEIVFLFLFVFAKFQILLEKPKTLRSSLRDINTVKYDRDLTSIYNERKSF